MGIYVFLFVFCVVSANAVQKKSMIVKRSEYGDQKVSASGKTQIYRRSTVSDQAKWLDLAF